MSKCDELKRYDIETDHGDTYEGVVAPDGFYMIADEVNEAIVEIKAENVRLKAENKWLKDENARLMSRPCYVCKEEQVKALEKKFQELEGGTLILYNENFRWRKFPEEKPDDEGDYLVMARCPDDDEPHIEICFYDRDGEDFGHYERKYSFGGFDDEDWITHNVSFWMPMPKAPEEAK